MPTYQYACTETECGHVFEQFQNFTEDSLTVCPECDGRLRKVFNAVGVVFKGSGFYRTDSRSSPSKDAPSGSGSGSTSAAPAKGADTAASTSGSSTSGSSTSGGSGSGSTSPGGSGGSTAPAGAGAA